ncbi:dihydroneopterin aldolase [Thiolapillus brandeum]|uniref:7,8-dihydroneopterin aldolase n=1 Tax=Thiolapillus brandeum TaxID=1076588 RepID=A0A7U6GJR0_9GAMM|nr:dihydroneopterin aldolase [Thiolapillus brandeum]BAO44973.1 dihydroneopterin aldolase [Thiolapillus brandeum]
MDIVFVRQLELQAIVGIHDWERENPQPLVMDLEMAADASRAAASDRIQDALDYHAVSKRITAYVAESRFQLLETLAEGCAEVLLREFRVSWLRLVLHKPQAVDNAASVGVIIERGRRHQ